MAYDFSKFKKQLEGTQEWLKKEYAGLRTGQATPALLDSVKVEAYGSLSPINQVATVSLEGARSIRISPYDMGQAKEIEKAIIIASLGVSVVVDDKGLRINVPDLTAERRTQIVKIGKEKLEEGKKQVRIHRDDVMKELQTKEKDGTLGKDDAFRYKAEAQKLVDEANKKLEENYAKKEKEILN